MKTFEQINQLLLNEASFMRSDVQKRYDALKKVYGHFEAIRQLEKEFPISGIVVNSSGSVAYYKIHESYNYRPTKESQRAKWMQEYEKLVLAAHPEKVGKIDWNTATFHYNSGRSPHEAAQRHIKTLDDNQ